MKTKVPDSTEPNHTSSPAQTSGGWSYDYDRSNDRFILHGRYSFGHFQGWSADGVTTEAEDWANIRLIAAAPSMLQVLKAVDYAWTNYQKDYKAIGYETIKMVRDAIQKAEGNQ